MAWNTTTGTVTCDIPGCDAAVSYPLDRASDGVDACHAASQKASAQGWYVHDNEEDGLDVCPRHRKGTP